ncbi:MAG TPA: hypothetical protein VJ964_01400 [Balneolaceae bacterium]|nr:hypothetical protein [Balneolaceae bacterium]
MLFTTIVLFAIAAVLGLVLITKVLKEESTPGPVVYNHGGAATIALGLLIIAYANQGDSLLMTTILVFVIAALGGFVMFGRDLLNKELPKWLAVLHALVAVTGFILLLIGAFGG